MAFKVPTQFRYKDPSVRDIIFQGNEGFFLIPFTRKLGKQGTMKYHMMCIASDKHGWDRVSVYILDQKGNVIPRTPLFEEMEAVKKYFWDDTDAVVQYHDLNHEKQQNPYMLHMWRPQLLIMAKPPKEAIL